MNGAGLSVGEAGQATALVVDAEVTSILMMGALSPGLKRHSVTLFEGRSTVHTLAWGRMHCALNACLHEVLVPQGMWKLQTGQGGAQQCGFGAVIPNLPVSAVVSVFCDFLLLCLLDFLSSACVLPELRGVVSPSP